MAAFPTWCGQWEHRAAQSIGTQMLLAGHCQCVPQKEKHPPLKKQLHVPGWRSPVPPTEAPAYQVWLNLKYLLGLLARCSAPRSGSRSTGWAEGLLPASTSSNPALLPGGSIAAARWKLLPRRGSKPTLCFPSEKSKALPRASGCRQPPASPGWFAGAEWHRGQKGGCVNGLESAAGSVWCCVSAGEEMEPEGWVLPTLQCSNEAYTEKELLGQNGSQSEAFPKHRVRLPAARPTCSASSPSPAACCLLGAMDRHCCPPHCPK